MHFTGLETGPRLVLWYMVGNGCYLAIYSRSSSCSCLLPLFSTVRRCCKGSGCGSAVEACLHLTVMMPARCCRLQDDGAADGAASPTREASTGGMAAEGNDSHAATAQQQGAAADPSAAPPVSTGTTQH